MGYLQSPYGALFGTEKSDMAVKTHGSGVNRKEYRNVNLVRPQKTPENTLGDINEAQRLRGGTRSLF